jgi:hypothetical protein
MLGILGCFLRCSVENVDGMGPSGGISGRCGRLCEVYRLLLSAHEMRELE